MTELMSLIQLLPWSFSAATAFCFALMARKARRGWLPWAIVGGAASLVITTLTLGAAEATFLPISHDAYVSFCIRAVLLAILLNVISGWVLTTSLHGRHVSILNAARGLWAMARNARHLAGRPRVRTIHAALGDRLLDGAAPSPGTAARLHRPRRKFQALDASRAQEVQQR
jgi:hypothetical protein